MSGPDANTAVPPRKTRRRVRRVLRLLGALAALGLVLLTATAAYWRQDKTAVFYEVRGNYDGFDVVDSWTTERSGVRLIALRNDRGEAVSTALVRRPLALDPEYKIILTYAGWKTGRRMLELIPERPDVVLVAMQYPYESPRGLLAHLRAPWDLRRAAFRTVAGGMLAVSFLQQDEALDLDRLTLIGASLGSFFAPIHGGLDERVPIVLVIHGGGDLPALVRTNLRQRHLAVPAGLAAEVIVHSFDPIHFAGRIAPRRFVMISSRNDTSFPVATAQKLYDSAGEPKEIIWTETEHVRSRRRDLVADTVRQIDLYLTGRSRESEPAGDPAD